MCRDPGVPICWSRSEERCLDIDVRAAMSWFLAAWALSRRQLPRTEIVAAFQGHVLQRIVKVDFFYVRI